MSQGSYFFISPVGVLAAEAVGEPEASALW